MRRTACLLLVLFSLLFASCAPPPIASEFQEKVDALPLPAGVWYQGDAKEWDTSYLPDALCAVFFEERPSFSWVLYLGTESTALCEILYAELHGEYDALLLASRLSARIETLKKSAGGAFSESLDDACVIRRGNCVLYTAAPLNEEILALIK